MEIARRASPFLQLAASLGIGASLAIAFGTSSFAAVNIGAGATKNMSCSAGVCSPTSKNAVLNASDLAGMLSASDVKVTTGSGAVTIEVTAAFSWISANRLTLDSNFNVSVKAPVTVAGPGGVSLVTNDGGSGGDLLLFPGGKIDFWDMSSSLIVNGGSYVLVNNIHDLADDIQANPSGSFALANDYDASVDGTYLSSPVSTTLGGTFEALGHEIANLTVAAENSADTGLFAFIGPTGIVRDLTLKHAEVSAAAPNVQNPAVGAIAGENDGLIVASSTSGSVDYPSNSSNYGIYMGGLVGWSKGTIAQSSSSVKISNQAPSVVVGGLVGFLDGTNGHASITDSSASGPLYARYEAEIGGLVGISLAGEIDRSHASNSVEVDSPRFIGGLVGVNGGGLVDSSFATGNVVLHATGNGRHGECGTAFAGGFVGKSTADVGHHAMVSNSYALGNVTGGEVNCIGGFTGGVTPFRSSYSAGAVSAGAGSEIGGFIGKAPQHDTVRRCYWDVDTSGQSEGAGNREDSDIIGLTDAQLKSGLPDGFDPAIWGQNPSINNGYPYLLANPPPK